MFIDNRSDSDYGESECDGTEPSLPGCSDILLFPVVFVGLLFLGILPLLALTAYFLADVYSTTKRTVENGQLSYPFLFRAGVVLSLILAVANDSLKLPKIFPKWVIPVGAYPAYNLRT